MAEQEVENEKNPLEDLVQYSLNQDFNNANKVFNDVISVKLNDVLDQEKIKLANQLYNGQPVETDDTEGSEDEDQLELDLDNEEDGGDVSAEAEDSIEDEETEEESSSDVEVEMADDEPSDDDTGGDEENGDEEISN